MIIIFLNLVSSRHVRVYMNKREVKENLIDQDSQNLTTKENFCNFTVQDFYQNWFLGSRYLSTFLNTLESQNCTQFEIECKKQTFALNRFTTLLYSKFCNQSEYENLCINDVRDFTPTDFDEEVFLITLWMPLAKNMSTLQIGKSDLSNECLQVAMYNYNQSANRYFEIVDTYIPFCSAVWCGFDRKTIIQNKISFWTCLPLL